MASDEDRKKAGAAKRRKRWIVTTGVVGLYLIFYISGYLGLRSYTAYIQPLIQWYPPGAETPKVLMDPDDTIYPSKRLSPRLGKVLDGFFLPAIWVEEKCCNRQVWFRPGNTWEYHSISF